MEQCFLYYYSPYSEWIVVDAIKLPALHRVTQASPLDTVGFTQNQLTGNMSKYKSVI
jgi:hypothetical protein